MSRKREFEDHDFDAQRFNAQRFDAQEFEKFMPTDNDPSMKARSMNDDSESRRSPNEAFGNFGSGEIDPLVWERLIDSQLPHDQYAELLRSMEARPELWRDCALAFLERQAWADALNDLGWETPTDQPTDTNDLSDQQLAALLSNGFGVHSQTDRSKMANRSEVATGELEEGYLRDHQDRATGNPVEITTGETGQGVIHRDINQVGGRQTKRRSHWLKPIVMWIPTSVAAVLLVGLGVVELSKQPTVAPSETSPAVQLADVSYPAVGESMEQQVVEQFNQLPLNQRQKIFSAAASYDVSATVPSSPAVFRQRDLDANRKFVFVEDSQGTWFVVPVDRFRSLPRDVQ